MMVSRSLFRELGGFDEGLTVDFGDIDFCLRAGELGKRVVWTPRAFLRHHERSSLPRRTHPRDYERFRRRWRAPFPKGIPFIIRSSSPPRTSYPMARLFSADVSTPR